MTSHLRNRILSIVKMVLAGVGALVLIALIWSPFHRVLWERRQEKIHAMCADAIEVAIENADVNAGISIVGAARGSVMKRGVPLRCPEGHDLVWMSPAPSGDEPEIRAGMSTRNHSKKLFFACCARAHPGGGRFFVFADALPQSGYLSDSEISWYFQRRIETLDSNESAIEANYVRNELKSDHPNLTVR